MGNLGFQELLLLFIVIGVPLILIFILVKYLNGRNNSKNKTLNTSAADEVEGLYSLKEKGIITQKEFDNKKAQLLNRI